MLSSRVKPDRKRARTAPVEVIDLESPTLSDSEGYQAPKRSKEMLSKPSNTFPCKSCSAALDIERLYSLDYCSHKFCRPCLSAHVLQEIQTEVASNIKCPLKDCKETLSARDVQDFLPSSASSSSTTFSNALLPNASSLSSSASATPTASKRLAKELQLIQKGDSKAQGFSVGLVNDSLFLWEVKVSNFDANDPIAKDLLQTPYKHILMHITFPRNFPMAPPFVRVIRPRFQYMTGHVTLGGSICTELLTQKGWNPASTIESVILTIRTNFLAGNARIDLHSTRHSGDYTEGEARSAYNRALVAHGWQ